jgi:amino acid transporter
VTQDEPKRVLSLFDTTNLIVGIIVGAGVMAAAPEVAGGAGSAGGLMLLWISGGLLSLCGAVGYAELATTYPEPGGDYVYLSRAYGRWAGFLFGWIQTLVVRPGDIAVMAYVFAVYASTVVSVPGVGPPVLAVAAVVGLTLVNVAGVRGGIRTQNLLTVVKVAGLGVVVVVTMAVATRPVVAAPIGRGVIGETPLSVALILVLFAYGGWNEAAYVAAEVRRPRRDIVRAMMLGMAMVVAIYLVLNAAFLEALGLGGLAASDAPAVDAVARFIPGYAGSAIALLICVCALGAVNGLVFAGARIAFAVGRDHRLFRALGRWSGATGTPARALVLQGALAVVLVVALGSFVDTVLYTAGAVYLFYLATSVAVIVLRFRDRHAVRQYRATGYPWTTLVFCGVCVFLIVAAVRYRPSIAVVSAAVILAGVPAFLLSERIGRARGIAGSGRRASSPVLEALHHDSGARVAVVRPATPQHHRRSGRFDRPT